MYEDWKRNVHEKLKELPLGYAESDVEFINLLEGWGINPAHSEEVEQLEIHGEVVSGWYHPKKYEHKVREAVFHYGAELKALMQNDSFVIEGFYYELIRNGYVNIHDITDVIYAMGLDEEEFYGSYRLMGLMRKAIQRYLEQTFEKIG